MKPMDIYIANVPFDEKNGAKVRPALVMEIGVKRVNIFKVTSQYQKKSEVIKKIYYPIKNWKQAGLKKISYVDTHKLYSLNRSAVFSKSPIGKLSYTDRIELLKFLKQKRPSN